MSQPAADQRKPPVEPELFQRLDLRIGQVVDAQVARGTRRPALWLTIDFGPLGVLRSSAQITDLYRPEELVGRQVVAVVNLPPKRIAGFVSDVLVLGAIRPDGAVVLLAPDRPVPPGLPVA